MDEIKRLSEQGDFWNDQRRGGELLKEKTGLERDVDEFTKAFTLLEELEILNQLAEEEADSETLADVVAKLADLGQMVTDLELSKMLSGPNDASNALLTINAGAGGTEACDWAQILLRMYLRWCERRGYRTAILDELPGDGAGFKNVTIGVEGHHAYGFLRAENGVHRLVRISPFDANKRRHTSFASVYVYPELADDIDVSINEADLRVDTYRASGAGGQHVNKTESAIRITHMPTGIVVACQNERSQHKNRAMVMKMLKARLYDLELQKRQKTLDDENAKKQRIEWGSQIRSYVLQPYRLVKDVRTGMEIGDVDRVLDGDLDGLIKAYLLMA